MGEKIHLVLLIVITVSIGGSKALECYYCGQPDKCLKNSKEAAVRDITNGLGAQGVGAAVKQMFGKFMNLVAGAKTYPYCAKAYVTKVGGDEVISRFGLHNPSPELNGKCIEEGGSKMCYCNTNKCNNAASVGLSSGALFFGVVIAILKFQL